MVTLDTLLLSNKVVMTVFHYTINVNLDILEAEVALLSPTNQQQGQILVNLHHEQENQEDSK